MCIGCCQSVNVAVVDWTYTSCQSHHLQCKEVFREDLPLDFQSYTLES